MYTLAPKLILKPRRLTESKQRFYQSQLLISVHSLHKQHPTYGNQPNTTKHDSLTEHTNSKCMLLSTPGNAGEIYEVNLHDPRIWKSRNKGANKRESGGPASGYKICRRSANKFRGRRDAGAISLGQSTKQPDAVKCNSDRAGETLPGRVRFIFNLTFPQTSPRILIIFILVAVEVTADVFPISVRPDRKSRSKKSFTLLVCLAGGRRYM